MADTERESGQPPQEDPVERILQKAERAVLKATEDGENITNVEVSLEESNDVVDEAIEEISETYGALVHEQTGDDYVRGKYRFLQINLNHREAFKPDFTNSDGALDMMAFMDADTENAREVMFNRMKYAI